MPSTYAHRRFGADVLALLPDGLRATLEQHRDCLLYTSDAADD